MTREEATIQSLMGHIEALENTIKRQSETIKALEQEPCEDCISRKDVLAPYKELKDDAVISVWLIKKNIEQQLSVTPKPKIGRCKDCISRRAVLDMTICDGISCDECSFNICENGKSGCLLNERISELPPVTPTRKTGHWILRDDICKCSNCKDISPVLHNYCPNCGAKMESEDKE